MLFTWIFLMTRLAKLVIYCYFCQGGTSRPIFYTIFWYPHHWHYGQLPIFYNNLFSLPIFISFLPILSFTSDLLMSPMIISCCSPLLLPCTRLSTCWSPLSSLAISCIAGPALRICLGHLRLLGSIFFLSMLERDLSILSNLVFCLLGLTQWLTCTFSMPIRTSALL